jgi:hypothetical protein
MYVDTPLLLINENGRSHREVCEVHFTRLPLNRLLRIQYIPGVETA